MTKPLLLLAAFATLLLAAACGGGDDDSGGDGGGGDGNTAGMAAAFSTELTKIKTCVAPEASGGAACGINFLLDPVTLFCSDVRTGKINPQFPKADLSKFTATCDDWKNVLTMDAATKVTTLDKMIAAADALK